MTALNESGLGFINIAGALIGAITGVYVALKTLATAKAATGLLAGIGSFAGPLGVLAGLLAGGAIIGLAGANAQIYSQPHYTEEEKDYNLRTAKAEAGAKTNSYNDSLIDRVNTVGAAYDKATEGTAEYEQASLDLKTALIDLAGAFPNLSEKVLSSLND
jgi:hypothetical protein